MNGSTVSAEVELRLVVRDDAEDLIVPLVAGLSYSSGDPYAVSIGFHVGLDEPVEWTFARDLLSAGMSAAAGEGDVKICPSVNSRGGFTGVVANIEISSPHGAASFEAPVRDVTDFLQRTYEVVPEGQEGKHVDVDAELADLLRETR
ncbi:MAG: SsgA family sporulation/cell division regulator [Streptosporangiales bacterium]|nr:SsgA family sporulation/cell division regulator [Streptosporangiales bacterium]